MTSTRDPETMTADERQREVAAILARGLLRHLLANGSAASSPPKIVSEIAQNSLDLPSDGWLSVAQRPAGKRAASRTLSGGAT